MESPRGNEFLKFFIGRENRSDSNREVPNVGYEQLITDSISAMWGNACETASFILFRTPPPSHAEFSFASPA